MTHREKPEIFPLIRMGAAQCLPRWLPFAFLFLVSNTLAGDWTNAPSYLLRFDVIGINNHRHSANAVAALPDGSVLAAGSVADGSGANMVVVKLKPAGGADETFGEQGWVVIDSSASDSATAMTVQNDGKIVLGGWVGRSNERDFALVRLNPNGSRDVAFGKDGVAVVSVLKEEADFINDIAVMPDGKIVAVGVVHFANNDDRIALARLQSDGSADTGFGQNGVVIARLATSEQTITCRALCGGATSVEAMPDGRLLVGAESPPDSQVGIWRSWVLRFGKNGELDKSFSGDGKREVFRSTSDITGSTRIVLQPDGAIVVGGGRNVMAPDGVFQLARLTNSGDMDGRFGINGRVTTHVAPKGAPAGILALDRLADGGLVAAGVTDIGNGTGGQFAIVRYLQDGSVDRTFANGGFLVDGYAPGDGVDAIFALAPTIRGGFVAAGWTQMGAGPQGVRFGIAQYEDFGGIRGGGDLVSAGGTASSLYAEP